MPEEVLFDTPLAAHHSYCSIRGFSRVNVTQMYPDPVFASNVAGRPLSRLGALSQMSSISPRMASAFPALGAHKLAPVVQGSTDYVADGDRPRG